MPVLKNTPNIPSHNTSAAAIAFRSDLSHYNDENKHEVAMELSMVPPTTTNPVSTRRKHKQTSFKQPSARAVNAFQVIPEITYALAAAQIQAAEKEMIIQEEHSGEIVTRVYKLYWKNGSWKKQLKYTLKEIPRMKDVTKFSDSTLKFFPIMQ